MGRKRMQNRKSRRCLLTAAALGASALTYFANNACAALNAATWAGASGTGGNGAYITAANWSGGVVPNNGLPGAGDTYSVSTDGAKPAASLVTLDGIATVSDLTIGAGDGLTVTNAG